VIVVVTDMQKDVHLMVVLNKGVLVMEFVMDMQDAAATQGINVLASVIMQNSHQMFGCTIKEKEWLK